ncbi:MAG: universal stress protein [Gammaproteobacteria bacterium]|nr:universal stress protein [Gammaproteobacteria bacterium]NND59662.1 universal stress protein [Gammaproteobacteria bacterium]
MDKRYHRIAVVPDPTVEQQPALEKAARLARDCGAKLDLIGVNYNEYIAGSRMGDAIDLEGARDAMTDNRRDWLETIATPYRDDGVDIRCHASFAHPLHQAILDAAAELEPDLLVKDTHYHAPLTRALFSHTDWELIRRCPIDLLLVKPAAWSSPITMLAAVDPMHEADDDNVLEHAILSRARTLADKIGSQLHVVHACPLPIPAGVPGYTGLAVLDIDEFESGIEQAHRNAVDKLVDNYKVDGVHIGTGPTPHCLIDFADDLGADVMIIGALSRSKLGQRFIGHTARRVLDRLPCDLLVVKAAQTD